MSMNSRSVVGVVVGSLLVGAVCTTAAAGTMTGRIVDLKGRGLADCNIEVLSAAGAVIGSSKSDADGKYTITLPENSVVALSFNRDDRLSTRLNLISGSTVDGKLDVVLPVKEFKFDFGPPPKTESAAATASDAATSEPCCPAPRRRLFRR